MEEKLQEKIKELEELTIKAEKSLKKAPKGSLVLSCSNGKTQYYYKTEQTQIETLRKPLDMKTLEKLLKEFIQ